MAIIRDIRVSENRLDFDFTMQVGNVSKHYHGKINGSPANLDELEKIRTFALEILKDFGAGLNGDERRFSDINLTRLDASGVHYMCQNSPFTAGYSDIPRFVARMQDGRGDPRYNDIFGESFIELRHLLRRHDDSAEDGGAAAGVGWSTGYRVNPWNYVIPAAWRRREVDEDYYD